MKIHRALIKLCASVLYALMDRVLSATTSPGTYNHSDRRLDYILGTKKVAEMVVEGGCLAYGDGFDSDHKTMFFDLNKNALLENFQDIQPEALQVLHTSKPATLKDYKEKFGDFCVKKM